ncbi:Protein of unknown function [Variovorax sp. HW608]|uniref:MbcA/ParS/Xre antitoxin family protein n=1 Tax=Variovorax sp. HW608 TaxID=1034889 RepID=UPI00081FA70A|nr:MbcA/ParS/Xre antitoxin family protein [Variovorax sp. HW608]SCK54340.1 Protein of unknown function [Variovorax sp. HW608]
MTMPHQRMDAFIQAGKILWSIVDTAKHTHRWGASLPKQLVSEVESALRHYPDVLELERAADEQRSMHTWMARPTRGTAQLNEVCDRLRSAAKQLGMEDDWETLACYPLPHLHVWLFNEHPALGYRAPDDLLDVTCNPDAIIELFKNEEMLTREACRVFGSRSKAHRWLRGFNRELGGVPLESLGSDIGRRRVMDELRRMTPHADR